MKRCPVCNTTFDDVYLSFCPNDGTPLLRMSADEAHTVLMTPSRETDPVPNSVTTPPPAPQAYGWPTTRLDAGCHTPPAIRGPKPAAEPGGRFINPGLISITLVGSVAGLLLFARVILGIVALMQIRQDPTRSAVSNGSDWDDHGGIVLAIYVCHGNRHS